MAKIKLVSTGVTSVLKKINPLFPVEIRHGVEGMASLQSYWKYHE